VTVFFTLSGFLVYRSFVAGQYGLAPAPRLRAYAARRALRIVPAYWLALTICLLVPGLGTIVGSLELVTLENAYVYYGFAQVYDLRDAAGGLGQAWTLCSEVVFYAALALYALLGPRLGIGPSRVRRELLLLAGLAIASTLARLVVHASLPNFGYPFNLTFAAVVLWFAAGMALATISCAGSSARPVAWAARHPTGCYALGGAVFAALGLFGGLPSIDQPYTTMQWALEHVGYGVIAVLIVAPAALGRSPSRVSALLASPPLRRLGQISYGVYLWHFVIVLVLKHHGSGDLLGARWPFASLLLTSLAGSIVAGELSYRLVERPLLERSRRRRRSRRDRLRPVAESSA